MRSRFLIPSLVLMFLAASLLAAQSSPAETMLEAARRMEVVDGDLPGAIAAYQRVVDEHGAEREIAARAMLQMAQAQAKLGSPADAHRTLDRLVREYGDVGAIATRAQQEAQRLGSTAEEDRMTKRQVWAGPRVTVEGTVSPDGRYLSFVDYETGDLAVRDLTTETDRRVTNKGSWQQSGDHALESTISPDGTRVAYSWYVSDARRYVARVMSLNGRTTDAPRTLLDNPEVLWVGPYDWSPDGKRLAVAVARVDRTVQIGLLSVADGNFQALQSVDWRMTTKMAFSPDGAFVAYDMQVDDASRQRDVFVIRTDGTAGGAVVEHRANDVLVGWSPDGASLLFGSDRSGSLALWAVPMTAGKAAGEPLLVRDDFGQRWSALDITRDGALYYGATTSTPDVYLAALDFETGRVLSLPRKAVESYAMQNNQPAWSLDGQRLAYTTEQMPNVRYLSILSLANGKVREVRPQMEFPVRSRWAPDGTITAEGRDLRGREGLYQIDPESGHVTPLVMANGAGFFTQPSWSPDGRWLVFRRIEDGESVIVARDVQAAQDRELRRMPRDQAGPATVSPDGSAVAYVERDPRAGSVAVHVMPLAGGSPREVLRLEQPFSLANLIEWTPDGRHIVVGRLDAAERSTKLVSVAPDGRREPVVLDLPVVRAPTFRIHPDGRQVAFTSGSTEHEVWSLENFLPAAR